MIFTGILAGFDVALLLIMIIAKQKERKSIEKLRKSTDRYCKFNALSDEELDEAYEKYIEHDPSIRSYDDYREAWNKAIDKAFEKHIKVLNGEER